MTSETRLKHVTFEPSYDTFDDNPARDFYIPALNHAITYRRAVGYFSSAILSVLAEAFTDFSERGGKIELICSPVLTPADAEQMELLSADAAVSVLNQSIKQLDDDGVIEPPLDLMAALVRAGTLKIKLAIPYSDARGIFHQKIGIFEDSEGDAVAFSGSNNESVSGWIEMKNSESFSVFTSWRDSNDLSRVEDMQKKMSRMWANRYPGFEILDFHESLEFIQRRANESHDVSAYKALVRTWYDRRGGEPNRIGEVPLRPYQVEVLENWQKAGYKGIVSFATGAGKTMTALTAIANWHIDQPSGVSLVIVPTVRLQTQWVKEIRKHSALCDFRILKVGGDVGDTWQIGLKGFMSADSDVTGKIVVAVVDSAVSSRFAERAVWGDRVLMVVDEVHNMGAQAAVEFLQTSPCARVIGLSATPKRYNDDENAEIRRFFGEDLKPIVDIPYAQQLGVLVNYQYHYKTVELTPDEEEKHIKLTRAIGAAKAHEESSGNDRKGLQILLSQRANILRGANNKIQVAVQILREQYRAGSSWLVFCNDQNQLNALKREIQDLGPLDYHGSSEGGSDETIELFERNGGILLSIRMLDEGIDIPSIDSCLIIASSKNERQFIQRRGRVLRVNRDKAKVADIWDVLVVDGSGMAYTDSEASRAIEFARMAINKSIVYDLTKMIHENGSTSSVLKEGL